MKKPNFFIIGAPKCGTTSLAAWLSEHPQVFMSSIKEPLFFNTDFGMRHITNLKDYEALFEGSTEKHLVVGEASTFYLNSVTAVPEILEYSPSSKFIVMLRNPVDMAVSLHAQVCKGNEDQLDFNVAWRLQDSRKQGLNLPRFCEHPELLQYGERCKVGAQLSRLMRNSPKENVLVIYLEDISTSPNHEFSRVIEFLKIDYFEPSRFNTHNSRVKIRNRKTKLALNWLGYIKKKIGIRYSTGLLKPFHRLNLQKDSGSVVSSQMKKTLREYFSDDMQVVKKIVGRVPESWNN